MADSIYTQCLEAVQRQIRRLALTGIQDYDIMVRKLPWNRNVEKPGIFVHPERETLVQATNASDDVGYGITVVMVQAANQDLSVNFERLMKWRQKISKHFRYQRLTGVSDIYQCLVFPQQVISPSDFAHQYDVSVLLIRCMARELRS